MSEKLERTVGQVIGELRRVPEIEIEVCGTWIWVTGNTYDHRAELKELGMKFSYKKQAWYYYDGINEQKHRFRGKKSLPQIRQSWGSARIPKVTEDELLQVA